VDQKGCPKGGMNVPNEKDKKKKCHKTMTTKKNARLADHPKLTSESNGTATVPLCTAFCE
jgi:hypothetical protein